MEAKAAAKAAAKSSAAAKKQASKKAAASPRRRAAAALEAAQRQERIAENKRRLAECDVMVAKKKVKATKALEVASSVPGAAPIQAKLEAFLRLPPLGGVQRGR